MRLLVCACMSPVAQGCQALVIGAAGENSIIIVGGANQAWPSQLPQDTQEVGFHEADRIAPTTIRHAARCITNASCRTEQMHN